MIGAVRKAGASITCAVPMPCSCTLQVLNRICGFTCVTKVSIRLSGCRQAFAIWSMQAGSVFVLLMAGQVRLICEDRRATGFGQRPNPARQPAGFEGETRSSQNGISSSRSISSEFSPSADLGRLRKSTFSAMISQP